MTTGLFNTGRSMSSKTKGQQRAKAGATLRARADRLRRMVRSALGQGMSLDEMAEECGCSRRTVCRIRNEKGPVA